MTRRILTICLLASSGPALLATAPVASAAKSSGRAAPKITLVSPMRVSVGARLTIKGRNFSPKRRGNTVIFRSSNGRSAFAKPRRATRTKLVVIVPAAVARLIVGESGRQSPTRFKLRVLAGRKFSKFTPRRLSPVVVGSEAGGGGDGGGGNAACNSSSDHDGDLLSNDFEVSIKTDPCLRDSDLDGVEDGYEMQSAIDLNEYPRKPPRPYPGKRPYPNALDSSDATTDYDGDALQLREEYLLWTVYSADGVARGGRPTSLSGLVYSDGLQKSIDPPPAPPADLLANWALDMDEDNELWDDERDADGDGLGNWDEQHGRMTEAWWPAQHDGLLEPKESKYPELDYLDNEDTAPELNAFADADMDGDGVLDGADDNDHDGVTNQFEVRRPADWDTDAWVPAGSGFAPGPNSWAYVNPFNPCKPFKSERCHRTFPFGYYNSDQRPPVGPLPPAGYPDSPPRPATPDG
jgi:hypothetical protein